MLGRGIGRRGFLASSAALAAGAAVSGPLAGRALAQAGRDELKIGLLTSLSGPFAALGESMRTGLQLHLQGVGGSLAGRPVRLIVEDDHAKPEEGVRKVRKLLTQDGVDIVCGVVHSGVALSIRDVLASANALTFISNGSANNLARKAASRFIFRPTKTNWMLGSTAGTWAAEKISKKNAITIAADYAAGREYVEDFIGAYKAGGGQVARQMWTPFGTTDFAPLLTDIAMAKPDLVYCFFAGSDAVRFLQQWQDYRLAGRIPLIGTGAVFDQEDVLPAVGPGIKGAVNAFHQSPTAPAPGAQAFVELYRKAHGRLPGEMSTSGYATGQVIAAAVDAVQGDLTNKDKVRDAVLALDLQTAYGPMRFDPANNQAILDVYINEVRVGSDGKPVNQVVHAYPKVSDPGDKA
ncbi:ABC transporter substrate-binding protein [Azospirillum sp.]|uniref:ABC transporter substrate-binding protein n=1 Tax=Azospirillum sp. TaxID=34012 RepID=UPI002D3EA4BF|nr:ABC transporter substrate-binding protein [Azospirillum sp.]HYD71188.1 ABC transporter substrate-binding protein [Azospirillum sp.]